MPIAAQFWTNRYIFVKIKNEANFQAGKYYTERGT